jgi:hypothetical protein
MLTSGRYVSTDFARLMKSGVGFIGMVDCFALLFEVRHVLLIMNKIPTVTLFDKQNLY